MCCLDLIAPDLLPWYIAIKVERKKQQSLYLPRYIFINVVPSFNLITLSLDIYFLYSIKKNEAQPNPTNDP